MELLGASGNSTLSDDAAKEWVEVQLQVRADDLAVELPDPAATDPAIARVGGFDFFLFTALTPTVFDSLVGMLPRPDF